ncbi:maleylpyruvate isomerase N-terminal domain-containing protein [Jiella avicenniae]|uniref:Maleylpyruvate isomerase N-terminal domain-containing protein n=1 Tax=Jiella avicenniae TaxID=2907202 RepID=A0A9X1P118_9HYPH|nr:maleylpyruvate isomerase N-terminal domain-containing protein [Jiella avicenniae]MCE7029422.1 maleylpyruvate isomerase N-terminal domain-containing protein [Jiella avicenniae]
MPSADIDAAAREALRARQGEGARYDAPNAPAEELLLARRGAAFFARKINELKDADFAAPSLRAGMSRPRLIAHVSYRARALALALKGLREGLTDEEAEWRPDAAFAATLPVRAIRHLYYHSDVHLNVEFRDCRPEDWDGGQIVLDGETFAVRATPLLRARDVWGAAVDLGNGARLADLPADVRPASTAM